MPQVLHLISSLGFFGAENVLVELARELRQSAFSPIVGVFENITNLHLEVKDAAISRNLPVVTFPCKAKVDVKTIFMLRKYLKKQRIDIIHSHGYKSNLYGLVASVACRPARVTTCHNWLGNDPKMKLYAWLDKFFLNRFDKVIAVSDTVKQEILNNNISSEKVLKIRNGINLDRFNISKKTENIRHELNIDQDYMVIGTVGRLSEEKGHIYLLDATEEILKKYPNTVFVFIGDGPLNKKLETRAKQIYETVKSKSGNYSNPFIFPGVRKDMPDIYSMMDIFILPSLTEGLPMVLLEAMASRIPVVATRVGAVPNVIEHNHSGVLIPHSDSQSIASALMDLLYNREKAKDLANNGRKIVEQEYSSKSMAKKYIDVYKSIL